jgi:hypothetical protein
MIGGVGENSGAVTGISQDMHRGGCEGDAGGKGVAPAVPRGRERAGPDGARWRDEIVQDTTKRWKHVCAFTGMMRVSVQGCAEMPRRKQSSNQETDYRNEGEARTRAPSRLVPAHPPWIAALAWNRHIEAMQNRHTVPKLALLHRLAALLMLVCGLATLHPAAALPDFRHKLRELNLANSPRLFGGVPCTRPGWQNRGGHRKPRDPGWQTEL